MRVRVCVSTETSDIIETTSSLPPSLSLSLPCLSLSLLVSLSLSLSLPPSIPLSPNPRSRHPSGESCLGISLQEQPAVVRGLVDLVVKGRVSIECCRRRREPRGSVSQCCSENKEKGRRELPGNNERRDRQRTEGLIGSQRRREQEERESHDDEEVVSIMSLVSVLTHTRTRTYLPPLLTLTLC